ncbi:glycosyltransferase family 31 protein [Dothistroma septosporum NZE10]|uniref:Glycosyltransferase family 31 protein n=1 Tax=Dothistroma septosporum (strain NZE10 / CBS 128990) TaxID=675120 RepID=N1PYB7_DOTSN|nr:glycosyltransferase family 31 protein [Dothistroma septosporum NZE10]
MGYSEKVHHAYTQRADSSMSVPGMTKLRRTAFPRKAAYLVLSACFTLLFFVYIHERTSSKDVLVILKTGATEIRDKLLVHLNTTLRCYPDYMLFSDYEENFHGQHVYDALEYVTPEIQEKHGDFELWRRLQEGGHSALKPQELSGPVSKPQENNSGKPSNPGWKLDKWKFLPMVNRTYHEYPSKKWYIFVETDTYILWQTLLNYLAALDETKPYYIGAQVWIGHILFAHGGTGFAVSNPAMKNVTEMFQEHQAHWEGFTSNHWAGDCILGKAFADSGTPLTKAWPIWQGDDIGRVTYWREDGPRRQWCAPAVSYHHLGPGAINDLWEFEQGWIKNTSGDSSAFLRHKDMFSQYLLPKIEEPRANWDNHANDDLGPVQSLQECGELCEDDGKCLQYRLTPDLRCLSGTRPMLGEWAKGVESGWVVERIREWGEEMEQCGNDTWIT